MIATRVRTCKHLVSACPSSCCSNWLRVYDLQSRMMSSKQINRNGSDLREEEKQSRSEERRSSAYGLHKVAAAPPHVALDVSKSSPLALRCRVTGRIIPNCRGDLHGARRSGGALTGSFSRSPHRLRGAEVHTRFGFQLAVEKTSVQWASAMRTPGSGGGGAFLKCLINNFD